MQEIDQIKQYCNSKMKEHKREFYFSVALILCTSNANSPRTV